MDDSIRKMIDENPLLSFSLYTSAQVQTLRNVGEELIGSSENWTDTITDLQRVYDFFWLWVLGAYEVVRTMSQNKECFSTSVREQIVEQKRALATIRMPFAKQELKGNGKPVYSELSVKGINKGMVFVISGETYNSTTVVESFLGFIDGIKTGDVINEIPVNRPN
ncbi:MAG: hypothetical protein COB08_006300 [Rhodobacteraceae bacterium]|nr:hypothetical protein [Paracoccaceae bacterium]